MAKAKIGLLIQSIFTFIVGLILASQGLPSNEAEATLYTGDTIINALNETTDDQTVADTAANFKSAFLLWGSLISFVSLAEFLATLISIFKS